MKRWMLWMMTALLCLLPLLSLAEGDALFPAKGDNGLWGYIDRTGAFVIPPQYAEESPWLNGYACVTADGENWGVVDGAGAYVLPMEYVVEWEAGVRVLAVYDAASPDVKPNYAVQWSDTVCGVFDTLTGHFSGFQWLTADLPDNDSSYVAVMDDSMTWGFADAATGEMVIPCQFAWADSFYNGWAIAGIPYEDETGGDVVDVLVSEAGDIIYPPEGLEIDPWFCVSEGLAAVRDPQTDTAGYMDVTGRLVIPPQWIEGYPFQGDFAVVWASAWEGVFQYIDRAGNILPGVRARPEGQGGYAFVNGLTSVAVEDPESGKWWPGAMNGRGEIVFTLTGRDVWLWNFMDNGLAWYTEWHPEAGEYEYQQRFYGLVDSRGNIVTDSLFKCIQDEGSPFSEGVAAVRIPDSGSNLYGYIDETGNWAIAPNYLYAFTFENGLAYVKTTDGRGGYIDRGGKEVYLWKTDENLYTWQSDLPQ